MTLLTPKEGLEINCSDEKYENIITSAVVKVNEESYFQNARNKKKFTLKNMKDLVSNNSNIDGKQINYIIVLHYCFCYYCITILCYYCF